MAEAIRGASARQASETATRPAGRTVARNVYLAAGIGLTVVALAVRLFDIDHEPLWLDEGYTLLFSSLSLARLLPVGGAHEHPPLYYLIVHFLLSVRNWYLLPRLVSAVAGAASVAVLFALGTRLFGRVAGGVAALCLAISPFHLWYSRDGRSYELAGLLVLLSYLLLVKSLGESRRVWWFAYSVTTALALYTEYTAALVLLPQLVALVPARRGGASRPLLIAWACVALLFAPWLGMLTVDVQTIAGNYWIPPPSAGTVVSTVLLFVGLMAPCPSPPCKGAEAHLPLLLGHEGLLALGVAGIVAATLVFAVRARDWRVTMVTLWLVVPFAIVLALALRRSLYLDRVFLDATYALYLLVAAAIAVLVKKGWGAPGATIALVLLGVNLANAQMLHSESTNPDWKTLARDLAAGYSSGQAVMYHPAVLRTLVHPYLPGGWQPSREGALWYSTYLDVPGWQSRYRGQTDAQIRDHQLAEVCKGVGQVWLVAQDYTGLNDTRYWFTAHHFHLLVSEIYRGDTRLELWSRGGPAWLGRRITPKGFDGWTWTGRVVFRSGVATEEGRATLSRAFPVVAGRVYSVDLAYQAVPPAYPRPTVTLYDAAGNPVEPLRDRFGDLLTSFPRSEWYDWPVNGAWLSQPIGFVVPPTATRAVIRFQNLWGGVTWRRATVYQEP